MGTIAALEFGLEPCVFSDSQKAAPANGFLRGAPIQAIVGRCG
jgi:hypothetical protein